MGCWNETCMVSNLPILGGEECAIAILLEQGTPYLGITPIDKYMPLAIIHGEYNEYGHLENIDEAEESALLSALPALALKQTEIWNYVDCSVSSLTDLLDKIKNGVYVVDTRMHKDLLLRVVFLKKRMLALAKMDEDDRHVLNLAFSGDTLDALNGIKELTPFRSVNRLIEPFQLGLIRADKSVAKNNAELIFGLNQLLLRLRKTWYIPFGSGSQCELTDEMLAYSSAYIEEIRSLKKQLSN